MWIDGDENTVHRADQATTVPQPVSEVAQVPSVADVPPHVNQHAHTAYAYPPVYPTGSAPAVDDEPVQTPEAPTFETLVPESPVAEAPVAEAPVAEAPVADAPITDAPVIDSPSIETPASEPGQTGTPVVHRRFDQPSAQPPSNHWNRVANPSTEEATEPAIEQVAAPATETTTTETQPIEKQPFATRLGSRRV